MVGHIDPFSGDLFSQIASLENLFLSFREFRRGKRKKLDVQRFEIKSENNLFTLHEKLSNKIYRHSDYTAFYVTDPKLRHIHKASVPDRIIHHAVYRVLYPLFDKSFIFDSYSCRLKKGTHKAVLRLEKFAKIVSQNYAKPCHVLKCDIRKFFDSVNHEILLNLIGKKISDKNCLWLIKEIIDSFPKYPQGFVQPDLFERERESTFCVAPACRRGREFPSVI